MNKHDTTRNLFSQPEMVASLVRTFGAKFDLSPEEIEQLDFKAMEQGPGEIIWEGKLARYVDQVWKIPVRGAPADARSALYLFVEIQAEHDPDMDSRMMECTGLLHDELRHALKLKPSDPPPWVRSVVLNLGKDP